jgi:hypothetical protein
MGLFLPVTTSLQAVQRIVSKKKLQSEDWNLRHSKNWKAILLSKIKYIGIPATLQEIRIANMKNIPEFTELISSRNDQLK